MAIHRVGDIIRRYRSSLKGLQSGFLVHLDDQEYKVVIVPHGFDISHKRHGRYTAPPRTYGAYALDSYYFYGVEVVKTLTGRALRLEGGTIAL